MGLTVVPLLRVPDVAAYTAFLERAFGARRLREGCLAIDESPVEVAAATAGQGANRTALHVYVPDADAAYARSLEAGARSLKEPVDQPYGDREASIEDPAGNHWYIATHQAGSSYRPDALGAVTPYLHVAGAARFIEFLKSTFDAETRECHGDDDGIIHHAKVAIGDSVIELSEAREDYAPMPAAMHVYYDGEPPPRARIKDAFGYDWLLDRKT